ncbi:30S ribosomal protein S18 [Turneriella parva]|jgi:small subunit ribosomal protein S18|uniref:Small ribosomal subunit protein bS18 n=1 Tax=Turneriella parva (strain ATCC BAA-1111 / DSM 21527 / NCTC 11395 / H) TaxID=869212 RepID=I4B8K3_TURPD|nr:30S ribosomal protein S18 [Turneriella parva]AFM13610.1 30S ribosomal protein S18 [Turneriella parva DSM 21527]
MEERQDREPRRGPDDGDDRRGGRGGPRFKKKTCRFCEVKDMAIEYKRVDILVKLVSNKGKILPRRLTGTCALHQRLVAKAIKKARNAGFMPFSV